MNKDSKDCCLESRLFLEFYGDREKRGFGGGGGGGVISTF